MKRFDLTLALRACGVLLLAVSGAIAAGGTMSGAGTAASPFEIEDIDDLKAVCTEGYPDSSSYVVVADIDGSSKDFKPIGCTFKGVFDGQKHTISNLIISDPDSGSVGLFSRARNATIKNLTLKNVKATGDYFVGSLVGEIADSRIDNVFAVNGYVRGITYVGGLVGMAGHSVQTGIMDTNGIMDMNVVASTGSVWGLKNVGGVVGTSSACITNAFSVSVIKGYENVGGIVGDVASDGYGCDGEEVFHAYSASIIKAPEPSGILGDPPNPYSRDQYMTDVYFDSTVATNIHEEEGRPTVEMMSKATYEGFDFDSVWIIMEGMSYPYFPGMDPVSPGKLVDDGSVNVLAGFGTEELPYLISTYEELKYVGKYEYKTDLYYMLTDDIDASESAKENCNSSGTECKGFEPIDKFSGVFKGNKKEIRNLTIARPDEDSVGLFRALDSTAKVYNMLLLEPNIRGKNYVGGLAGVDFGTTVDSIYVRGDIYGKNYVGSIVGYKASGTLNRNASKGTVTGADFVGGLVGYLDSAKIMDCYSIDLVQGDKYVGGLVGYSNGSEVETSYAVGRVDADSSWGGIVGGKSDTVAFYHVYYDSSLWHLDSTAGDGALSTKEMIDRSNIGFNFRDTWGMVRDSTYPYLLWIWWERVAPGEVGNTSLLRMAGSGTEDDPFLVKTYADLKSIGMGKYKLSAAYRLANDIDASASKTDNADNLAYRGFVPIGNRLLDSASLNFGSFGERDTSGVFTGKFDGAGHTIKNLYMEALSGDSLPGQTAFIMEIDSGGVVDNLSLIATVSGNQVAGIAVFNNGTISKSKVDVVVKHGTEADRAVAGGIVATNFADGVVSDCHATVDIEADSIAGGIVGINVGTVTKSTSSGTIEAKTENAYAIGGAIGENRIGLVDGVGSFVNVTGKKNIGGFVGVNHGSSTIVYSYATGDVRNTDVYSSSAGAFVSSNDGTIMRSFATGDIYDGFTFASANTGAVEDCYATGNAYAAAKWKGSLGFVHRADKKPTVRGYFTGTGYQADGSTSCIQQVDIGTENAQVYFLRESCNADPDGPGLTDSAMRVAKSFPAFDFDSVWTINQGKTYPLLRGMMNAPIAGNLSFDLSNNKSLTKTVQSGMNDAVIAMGASATVVKLDPASAKLLDSLANGKSISGKFELTYRVGAPVGTDTLWGNKGHIELKIDYKPVAVAMARVYGSTFGVALQGTHLGVHFGIPAQGSVKFALLDMQGRVVRQADFGNRAPGAYFETLMAGGISSGRYVAALLVNGRWAHKTMVNIR